MARGVRKSPMEKLTEELESTRSAIEQYKACLDTLKEKEKKLREQMEMEELKALSELLKNQNMSVEELKELVVQSAGEENGEQSA